MPEQSFHLNISVSELQHGSKIGWAEGVGAPHPQGQILHFTFVFVTLQILQELLVKLLLMLEHSGDAPVDSVVGIFKGLSLSIIALLHNIIVKVVEDPIHVDCQRLKIHLEDFFECHQIFFDALGQILAGVNAGNIDTLSPQKVSKSGNVKVLSFTLLLFVVFCNYFL